VQHGAGQIEHGAQRACARLQVARAAITRAMENGAASASGFQGARLRFAPPAVEGRAYRREHLRAAVFDDQRLRVFRRDHAFHRCARASR
jgi:hypothetical protein